MQKSWNLPQIAEFGAKIVEFSINRDFGVPKINQPGVQKFDMLDFGVPQNFGIHHKLSNLASKIMQFAEFGVPKVD